MILLCPILIIPVCFICSLHSVWNHWLMVSGKSYFLVVALQALSHVPLFETQWTPTHQAPVLYHLPELAQIHVHWVGDAIQPSRPLSSSSHAFSLPASGSFSALHIKWPKYWSFNFSISSSDECSRLISFRIDWFDLLAVQGTLKSLLQQESSKASILQHSAFSIVQLSHRTWLLEKP